MIDTHVHFWKLGRGDYGWLKPDRSRIFRDFLPDDFLAASCNAGIDGVIAVQAAPTTAETLWLLDLAETNPWILAVTGWVDLAAADPADALRDLRRHPKLKAIRPMEGVAKGPEWLSGPEFQGGLRAIAEAGLALEALLLPHHLTGLAAIVERHSDLIVVIDHAAKPTPATVADWEREIVRFAPFETVLCKVSGFTAQSLDMRFHERVLSALLETFGPMRLIWGSDYPVLLETSDYQEWIDVSRQLLSGLCVSDASAVLHANATRIYGLH